MRVRNANRNADDKIELQMTPMIDIVFQLLIFFIMTFKIVVPEGDFNIKMPLAAPSQGEPDDDQLPPIKVMLNADSNGNLNNIIMGSVSLGNDTKRLREKILGMVGKDMSGPTAAAKETEIEFDCAYNLKFKYVIDAITAVSGYVENKRVIRVIEKIKFSPPRKPPS